MAEHTETLPELTEDAARAVVLRALTMAPKTRKQLTDLLARRGACEEVTAVVLDRFATVGLIDDADYAQSWVRCRQSGRGRRALRQELVAKGIDAEDIDAALAEVDDDSERQSALRLVERKLRSMDRLDPASCKRRLFGMLVRRGYSMSLASAVVDEALADLGASGVN